MSAFGELRSTPGFAEAVLLTLDAAGVSAQEALPLQRRPQLGIDAHEPASDAETQRIRLAGDPAPFDLGEDVVLTLGLGGKYDITRSRKASSGK
jgi:hypothetical protein